MQIIYEDDLYMVVYKKAGQLTQSGKNFDVDLTSEVLNYRKKKGEAVYAALINRLDRPVSGLVLFAKTKNEAARLSKQMQQGGFSKYYYACIYGKMEASAGVLVDYLKKDDKSNTSFVTVKTETGAKRAELEYKVMQVYESANKESISLVQIRLITGRHHQIRVQFASRGCPVLGDVKYCAALSEKATVFAKDCGIVLGRHQIALCAYSLKVDGKVHSVEPEWLKV